MAHVLGPRAVVEQIPHAQLGAVNKGKRRRGEFTGTAFSSAAAAHAAVAVGVDELESCWLALIGLEERRLALVPFAALLEALQEQKRRSVC